MELRYLKIKNKFSNAIGCREQNYHHTVALKISIRMVTEAEYQTV